MSSSTRLQLAVNSATQGRKIDEEKLFDLLEDEDFSDASARFQDTALEELDPECMLIVANLPKVEEGRIEKLKKFVLKKIDEHQRSIEQPLLVPLSCEFPLNEDSTMSKGVMLLHFNTLTEAQYCKNALNDYRLDKSHRLRVFSLREYNAAKDMSDEFDYNPPDKPSLSPESLCGWIKEDPTAEQFLITIMENNSIQSLTLDRIGALDTDDEAQPTILKFNVPAQKMCWSPRGTFLALISAGGLCLGTLTKETGFNLIWAGKAPEVAQVCFSENEKYLAFYNDKSIRDNVTVVDTAFGRVLWRGSVGIDSVTKIADLTWSYDSSYMLVKRGDVSRLYTTSDFKPHSKALANVFCPRSTKMSPKSNLIAYWTSVNNDEMGITWLYDINSDVTHKLKQVAGPKDCNFYFQDNATYLCIVHERFAKKKSIFNLDVVLLKEKDTPIISSKISNAVLLASWEPNGDTFITMQAQGLFAFYRIVDAQIQLTGTKVLRECFDVLWSPCGRIVVIHSVNSSTDSKEMKIYDSHKALEINSFQFKKVDHISWDYSGRFLVTYSVARSMTQGDSAYTVWNMIGELIKSETVTNMGSFLWRPRPPCLLSDEELDAISRNLKSYSAQFDKVDRERARKLNKSERKEAVFMIVSYYNTIIDHAEFVKAQYRHFCGLD